MENNNIPYLRIIESIINGLTSQQISLFKELNHLFTMNNIYGKTPVLFIKDNELHFITRLFFMVAGEKFVVIPTSVDKSLASTLLSSNSKQSVIITDCVDVIVNINSSLICEDNPILNHLDISNVESDKDPFHRISELLLLSNPASTFIMTVYDSDRKLQREVIESERFSLLFMNLKALFAINDIHLNQASNNDCTFMASTEIFFLYKAIAVASRTIDWIPREKHRKTLIISYRNFRDLWDKTLEEVLQRKLLFDWYLHKFFGRFVMFYIIKQFEKHLRNYKTVIVLGLINDPVLQRVSNNLREIKVFNTFGEVNTMMASAMSDRAGYVKLTSGIDTSRLSLKDRNINVYQIVENEKTHSSTRLSGEIISNLNLTFFTKDYMMDFLSIPLFKREGDYAKYVGASFSNGVCPETIESIFNNFPFIRDTVLVKNNKGNYVLFIDTKEYLLDVSRVNYNKWQNTLRNQVLRINKLLNRKDLVITGPFLIPSDVKNQTTLGLLDKSVLYEMEFVE